MQRYHAKVARNIRLHSLHIYPVKSGRVIDLDVARIGPRGLQYDREWMFITAEGRFITQRSHPVLARLEATPDDSGVTLSHPHAGQLRLERPAPMTTAPGDWRAVNVWKRSIDALDLGREAARFASAIVGEPARIVAAGSDNFPDGYPLLVCTLASLADVNRRLPSALPMTRFRPNLVLDGLDAWEEDQIKELRIGAVRLKLVKACTRCVMTSIDQQTGLKAVSPLPVLQEFRFDTALRGVTFGQNARVESGAGSLLRVGDAVHLSG
ncbi:MAG: MOSC domain-containing protein [Gammaproteobacteria bacterium]